jgi:cytochrome P450
MGAGSAVLLSHFMTHRMPELYAQPDKFLPERWATISPSPYEFMAFSAGPRLCLGISFAMMEMKIVLAMLLQRFRLSIVPELKLNNKALPVLAPKDGLPMLNPAHNCQSIIGIYSRDYPNYR